ncbi:MAG TPA: ImmA/IrrE family metallo-endopeptidase [Propionicimonas sp.]|jgi:Zn-dependent peptidase ImmA (M78 family)
MARADDQAARLLAEAGVSKAPVDVDKLAKHLGAQVVYEHYNQGDVSGMLVRQEGTTIIGVNSMHAATRQRFTIAHELGHLVLHRGRALVLDTPVRVNFRDRTSSLATDREEMEANRFAAELLMPTDLVLTAARGANQTTPDGLVAALAAKFEVSPEAMSYRLVNLGVLS